MTHLIHTINNYSLKPLAEFITDLVTRVGQIWVASLEAEAVRRVTTELRKHKSYRETYDQLSKLSDKELNDIGISRGMIHSVALEVYFDNQVK